MSSKVFSTGSDKLSRFSWDNSTIGVSNKSSIRISVAKTSIGMSISITKSSTGVNGTTGSSVLGLGSKDSWLIYGDNSTIGMTNKTIGVSSISMGIRQASVSIRIPGIGKGQAMGTKVSCFGCSNFSCVGRDHGTVGVSYQLGSGQGHACGQNLWKKKM